MSVAIIAEDFAGMRAQATGLAERAGLNWSFHAVRRRGLWARLPFRHAPFPLRSIAPIVLPPETAAILSVGGTGGVAGLAVARRHGLPAFQIQHPRMRLDRFDLIVANVHDAISGPNVVSSRNAMHGVTPERLAAARAAWEGRLRQPGRRLVSVLVGGANGRFRFGVEEAREMGRGLARLAREGGATLAVTPSRRTAPAALAVLREELAGIEAFVWDGAGENPYLGLLACADLIVATCDSVSMVSEAVATSAPVLVADLPGRSRRIGAFVATLEAAGRVRRFAGHWEDWPVSPLDDTPIAAGELRRRLGDRL
ncbi:mitochondrial fission ELM1 family protein [Acidomonas methanolica]|uniref:mitochondrial fission ELM1 family protein n=1 Tax=Acidomonas methanolica TaxID=437 RepID=UPI00211A77BD|nr:mitochondrial fission ELM1 family protein [Acidomonas methanolica]MCQ9154411.1 mitochondrial fission ELM1 family protein [Acidomonas methanolica]